jgi:O-antigen/teichoic acid export membrane protein
MSRINELVGAIKVYKGKKKLGKVLSVSVLNQVVSSGMNFALGIYLVRVFSPSDFGLYGIGFAIILFYSGIGNALFLTQMVVHTPDKAQEDKLAYAARILVALMIGCLVTATIIALFLIVGGAWLQWLAQYFGLGISIAAASVAYLLKDFFVRHAYIVQKEIRALIVNVTIAVSLLLLLFGQHHILNSISPEIALWIYASSNIFGVLVGFALSQLPISSVQMNSVLEDMREAWAGGKWALGGVSLIWAQSQVYVYVTAIFVGPAGVGVANAARLLVTPATFLIPAITQVVMPRLADMRITNQSKMLQIGQMLSVGLTVFALFYSAALLGLVDVVVPIVLGHKYESITLLVAAWCLVVVLQFSRIGTSITLQIMKDFRLLTLKNIVSTLVAITAAVVLMSIVGVYGAVLGVALGELILSILLYQVIKTRYCSYK